MNMKIRHTRRHFLTRCAPAALVLACFVLFATGTTWAAEQQQKAPRPPGTCGGWKDADSNGICDNSEVKKKPCESEKCPGHADNRQRRTAKCKGAPEGTCAAWKDAESNGYCAVSAQTTKGCAYTVCPAHKARGAGTNAPAVEASASGL